MNDQRTDVVTIRLVRQATPLFGYPTVEEAEQQLTEFLFGKGVVLED